MLFFLKPGQLGGGLSLVCSRKMSKGDLKNKAKEEGKRNQKEKVGGWVVESWLLALLKVLVESRGLDGMAGSFALLARVIATNFHSLVVALSGLRSQVLRSFLLL